MPDVSSSEKISSKTELISQPKWSECRVMKNVFCSACGIFLFQTGYKGVCELQSTVNSQNGMGMASQAVVSAFFGLSALFLPTITIRKLGCKLTMILSLMGFCPYIASNFNPKWSTLIPSAILLGLSGSLFWASHNTYVNKVSAIYKERVGREDVDSVAALFFGITSTFYQLTFISGNLILFLALKQHESSIVGTNGSHCGINFLEKYLLMENNTSIRQLSSESRNLLTGILLSSSVLAVLLVALVLDPLPYVEDEVFSLPRRLTATFKVMRQKNQQLMIPMALYVGMQEGFYIGEFTKAYVACSWGVYRIGLVTMCLGLSSAICAITSGKLKKHTGRIPIFATAALANVCTFIQLFVWTPDAAKPYLFFECVSLWGIFYGSYAAGIPAFYGELFRGQEEPAFANFYLWSSIGHCLSYSYSSHLSITTKLYLLIIIFCPAQVGYVAVEYRIRNSAGNKIVLSENGQPNRHISKETEKHSVF